jgi:hypothetical protein
MGMSDYIIFADESGDHGLVSIDPQFPLFALVFGIIRKDKYVQQVVSPFTELKFKLWGHDQVIFHERDIRKQHGDFTLLRTDPKLRSSFLAGLSEIIAQADMEFVVIIVDKEKHRDKYDTPFNPYELSLLLAMERTLQFLVTVGESHSETHILFESRGKTEDEQLEMEFRRIREGKRRWGYTGADFNLINFRHRFVDKKSNSSGLQLVDLAARPFALKYMRPDQPNRAYDVLEEKIQAWKTFP